MEFMVKLLFDVPKNADGKKRNFFYIRIRGKNPYSRNGLADLRDAAECEKRPKTPQISQKMNL
jgi:hypothetical protein